MTKTVMPEVGGGGNVGVWSGRCSREGVKITNTIAAKHHASGRDILDRKTKSVKFDRTVAMSHPILRIKCDAKSYMRSEISHTHKPTNYK